MEADVLPAGTQSVDGMNTHLKKGCLGVRRLAVQHHECVHTCRSLAFQLWIVLYNRGQRLIAWAVAVPSAYGMHGIDCTI